MTNKQFDQLREDIDALKDAFKKVNSETMATKRITVKNSILLSTTVAKLMKFLDLLVKKVQSEE